MNIFKLTKGNRLNRVKRLQATSRLGAERLEERRLMAGDIGLFDSHTSIGRNVLPGIQPAVDISLDNGELTILGTTLNDRVTVTSQLKTSGKLGYHRLTVTHQAGDGLPSEWSTVTNKVQSITFQGRDGDDYFRNETAIVSTAYGGNGADLLYGGHLNDNLSGGDGNDWLRGGNGDDSIDGGAGNDSIYGGNGDDHITGSSGCDHLWGGSGNDTLHGDSGNDVIFGHSGHDRMYGDSGDDLMYGGYGNDSMYGGSGNDTLYGQHGRDFIVTIGGGKDTITGGPQWDDVRMDETDRFTDPSASEWQSVLSDIEDRKFGPPNPDEC